MSNEAVYNHGANKKNFRVHFARFPILTATIGYFFLMQLCIAMVLAITAPQRIVDMYGFGPLLLLPLLPVVYGLQWWFAAWVLGKYTASSLRQKAYDHPLATIILLCLFLTDVPYHLSLVFGQGTVSYVKLFSAFEILVYYAFLGFVWWLVVCWLTDKVWRQRWQVWRWYKKIVDMIFAITQPLYRLVLAAFIAVFIGGMLFALLSVLFGYTGIDIQALLTE